MGRYQVRARRPAGESGGVAPWRRGVTAFLLAWATLLLAACATDTESLVLDGSTTPDSPFVELDAGRRHGCALRADGTVACWGKGHLAQLGDEMIEDSLTGFRPVLGVESASNIAAGGDFSCAIVAGGRVVCWGFNLMGQVGDGSILTIAAARTPVPDVREAFDVAAGADHTCAAVRGAVRCWGANHSGQLGDGTREPSVRPVTVERLDDAESLSAGSGFSCALRRTGRVSCWGLNSLGQLGDGGWQDRANPVEVRDLDEVAVVDSHAAMSCAVRAGGSVWCWGADASTRADRTTGPVRIPGVDGASDVAVGEGTACAVADRRAYCWEGFGPAREQIREPGEEVTDLAVEGDSLCTSTGNAQLRCAPVRW